MLALFDLSDLSSRSSKSTKCAEWFVLLCSISVCVIGRSRVEEGTLSDSESGPHWCGISVTQNVSGSLLTSGSGSGSSAPSEPGATVKSLIKSFDTAVKSEDPPPQVFCLFFFFFHFFSSPHHLMLINFYM